MILFTPANLVALQKCITESLIELNIAIGVSPDGYYDKLDYGMQLLLPKTGYDLSQLVENDEYLELVISKLVDGPMTDSILTEFVKNDTIRRIIWISFARRITPEKMKYSSGTRKTLFNLIESIHVTHDEISEVSDLWENIRIAVTPAEVYFNRGDLNRALKAMTLTPLDEFDMELFLHVHRFGPTELLHDLNGEQVTTSTISGPVNVTVSSNIYGTATSKDMTDFLYTLPVAILNSMVVKIQDDDTIKKLYKSLLIANIEDILTHL